MKINLSFDDVSLEQPMEWLLDRPASTAGGLFASLIVSTAGAATYDTYRVPLGALALLAFIGLLALGKRARDWSEQEATEIEIGTVLDGFSDLRGEADYYRGLSDLIAKSHAKFAEGKLENSTACWEVRNTALDTFLELECRRLEHLGIDRVSLIVGRVSKEHYLIRRVAGPLKMTVDRGDKCRVNQDIDDALQHFAPYAIHDWTSCFGDQFVIAAVAHSPLRKSSALGELRRIGTMFQLMYERFRLMESTSDGESDFPDEV